MKKLNWLLTAIVLLILGIVFAAGAFAAKPPKDNEFKLPDKAVKISERVYYLGKARDKGKIVEGYAIINFKKGYVKPGTVCGNGICDPGENVRKCPQDCGGDDGDSDTSSCYGFLARGAKWKTLEPYMVDPTNSEGLSDSFIRGNIAADIEKWESAAGVEILEDEITGIVDGVDEIRPDSKNEVLFGDIDQPGAIGVTIIWGVFGGPPKWRYLVEWDQLYDQVDFDWSDSGEDGMMDFENIATHELGHSVGMGDLYVSTCSEETMFGYATEGETKKRTLEAGDIKGIQELYK